MGAQPGILAALHTWSQTLVLHPHVHCLVTGGGLTPDGQWEAVRHGFLLPARVVMAVFRGKMLEAIRQALARGDAGAARGHAAAAVPQPPEPPGPSDARRKWNVRIMERYRHGAGVVTYLARYLRGGPIKNARLVAWDGARVTFTCRARQEEADGGASSAPRMTLPVADFLQRWLLHVPVPQTRVVRSYGLYHPTQPRRWRCAARRSGNRRWWSRRVWTGRRCVRSGGKPIPSGVPPVASCSCARASSRGEGLLPA